MSEELLDAEATHAELAPAEAADVVEAPTEPEPIAPAEPVADAGTEPEQTEAETVVEANPLDVLLEDAGAAARDLHAVLSDIEQIAIFWGGEVGTKLRHLVGEGRQLI